MITRPRRSLRAALASGLSVLLVASGLALGTTTAFAAPGPSVSVSEAPAAGGQVTVTGSGFATDAPGIYVGVGSAGARGFYQAGVGDTVWVATTNEEGATAEGGRTGKLNPDGSFTVTVTVPAPTTETPAYAVYTSRAHGQGMADPSQDTISQVAFADAPGSEPETETPPTAEPVPAEPTLSVSKTSGLRPDGETITVTGANIATGFANRHGGGEAGVYAQIGYLDSEWRPSQDAPSAARSNAYSVWVKENAPSSSYLAWTDNGDGTADFAWTVTIDYDSLAAEQRPGATLAVFTLGGGGTTQAINELAVPISFALPTVSVSKTSGLDANGETITVTGSGFLPQAPATSGTRPPLAGKFAGTYIVFGKFADVWRPSEGAPSSGRKTSDTRWAVHAADLPALGSMPGGVVLAEDGSFEVTLTVKKGFSGEPAGGNYGVYTYSGSGAAYDRFETYTPLSFEPAATDLTFTSSPAGQATAGDPVTLTARLASPIAGTVTFSSGATVLGTVTPDAHGVATLVVRSLSASMHSLRAVFTPSDPTQYRPASAGLTFTVGARPAVAVGSLTWGIKQSFRDYVTSSIARGAISSTGVGASGGAFVFSQASGGTFNGSTGTSNYSGTVRFTGHEGVLDLRLSNPVVRVDSAHSGTLLVNVNGSTVPFATLALSSGSKRSADGAVSFAGVPATLTTQGAAAFVNGESQFYPAGTALDPVSFTIGAAGAATAGTRTVAAFVAVANGVPPTPPATTGITLEGSADGIVEGGEVTITADGFQPNEQGITLVIYSDPIILATNLTADARGVVTWTGRLPLGLTGEHTLTLQGSVDRGIVLSIAEPAVLMMASSCVAEDASLTWGFKEAFRSYVSGAIAHGEWTVADGAEYDIPNFRWTAGSGTYDAATGEGELAFTGAVTFTGHGGVLNTTVSNPQVRFDGDDTATLLLDVSGDTRDGVAVNQQGVEFATIDLAAAESSAAGGTFEFASAPAVLTPAGSAAFGTYEPGTELDPITLTFQADGCEAAPTAPADSSAPESDSDFAVGWLPWAIIAAVLLLLAAVVWIVMARRRSAA